MKRNKKLILLTIITSMIGFFIYQSYQSNRDLTIKTPISKTKVQCWKTSCTNICLQNNSNLPTQYGCICSERSSLEKKNIKICEWAK